MNSKTATLVAQRDYFARANNSEQIRSRKLQHALGEKDESVAQFRARIAQIMREREGRGVFSVIGASPSDPALLRPTLGGTAQCN